MFIDNKVSKKALKYFEKKYENENDEIASHVLLFAIMQNIYLKFYNMERLERHTSMHKYSMSNYARAWQIVQQEGYQNIIHEFKKRVR